ncbi:MAG: pseudouridine synthase, partial [Candidatus Dormibacteraceae bacterium]
MRSGEVTVNGEVAVPGMVVEPTSDQILVRRQPIEPPPPARYLALHKPVGYLVTAVDARGRPTILDLLPIDEGRYHFFPVGRLDMDSSGLLLLTNDGDLAHRLTHPSYKVEKEYL